jgi:hypothetical protein
LVNAAIISKDFCQLLLTHPAEALATGYNGDLFQLTSEERNLILSIRASSLADFAQQLTVHLQTTALAPSSRSHYSLTEVGDDSPICDAVGRYLWRR